MGWSNIILIISGMIIFGSLAVANTIITDSGITQNTVDSINKMYGVGSVLGVDSGGIEFNQNVPEGKSGIWWRAYDDATNSEKIVGWFLCHYNSSINSDRHSHCAIEVLDNSTGTPSVNTQFAVDYGSSEVDPNVWVYSTLNLNQQGIFNKTGKVSLTPYKEFEVYPNDQSNMGLRVSNDSSTIEIWGLGTDTIKLRDNVQIGDGSSQKNITLTSPDGTEFTCGVDNGGTFSCS